VWYPARLTEAERFFKKNEALSLKNVSLKWRHSVAKKLVSSILKVPLNGKVYGKGNGNVHSKHERYLTVRALTESLRIL